MPPAFGKEESNSREKATFHADGGFFCYPPRAEEISPNLFGLFFPLSFSIIRPDAL